MRLGRSLLRERGLKSQRGDDSSTILKSLPSQGAWIEIGIIIPSSLAGTVAPFSGSVD